MTVLDTSGAIDYLLGAGVAEEVAALLTREGPAAAPDLIVFEVLAVLRRDVVRQKLNADRATAALADLEDLALELFPTLALRDRAWGLRENMTAADALFVALAERLGEPLATKDAGLASAAEAIAGVAVIRLGV